MPNPFAFALSGMTRPGLTKTLVSTKLEKTERQVNKEESLPTPTLFTPQGATSASGNCTMTHLRVLHASSWSKPLNTTKMLLRLCTHFKVLWLPGRTSLPCVGQCFPSLRRIYWLKWWGKCPLPSLWGALVSKLKSLPSGIHSHFSPSSKSPLVQRQASKILAKMRRTGSGSCALNMVKEGYLISFWSKPALSDTSTVWSGSTSTAKNFPQEADSEPSRTSGPRVSTPVHSWFPRPTTSGVQS